MPDIRLQDYVAKIKDIIQEDRYDEAIAHCQHILKHYPKHIETYCLLGEACLEKETYRESIEFFQRTLSADPENFVARVGLGIIYGGQGLLPEAIWQLERAFELVPGNAEVRRELQRLYAQRDGKEKARLKLTRGALGRLYARNGLYERAIGEFRGVLRQEPHLPDVRVALVEALWHEGRRLEAVEGCLELLDALPNCLKANLILAEVWLRGGHEDASQEKLSLARALDPENLVAQEMMGRDSPLPYEEVLVPELEFSPGMPLVVTPAAATVPGPVEWGLGAGGDAETSEIQEWAETEEWETTSEFPDWLQDMGVTEVEEAAPGADAGEVAEEAVPAEEIPDWLKELTGEGEPVLSNEEQPEGAGAGEAPSAGETPVDEVVPERPQELQEEGAGPQAEAGEPAAARVPRSLQALIDAGILDEADLETAMAEMTPEDLEAQRAEDVPDWLKGLVGGEAIYAPQEALSPQEEAPAEKPVAPLVDEPPEEAAAVKEGIPIEEIPEEVVPEWLRDLEKAPLAEAAVQEAPGAEEVVASEPEVPASLQALVVAGILDEADLETAMAEMTPEDLEAQRAEETPAWLTELMVDEEPVAEEAPVEEEVPAWLKELEAGAVEEEAAAAPPVTEEAPVEEEVPAWLKDLEAGAVEEEAAEPLVAEEAPVGEEIPAWLKALEAGEVEEVVAEAPVAEEAAIEAEVPAWLKDLEAGEVEEVVAEAPVAEEAAIEEEVPAWLRDLEAGEVEEEEAAEAPVAEEALVEEEIPAWLKALEAGAVEEEEAAEPLVAEEAVVEAVMPAEPEVPESLRALVEAGILDESDLQAAVEEMSAEDLEAQRAEEVPDWLSSLIAEEAAALTETAAPPPAAEVVEVLADESLVVETVAEESTLVEEAPGWLRGPKIEEAAAEAQEAPVKEAPVEAEVPAWVRELEVGEETPSVAEAAPVPEKVVGLAPEQGEAAPPATPEPPPEEAPSVEAGAPLDEEGPVEPSEQVEVEEEEEKKKVAPPSRVDELLAQVTSRPRDYEARLELARIYRGEGDWNAALGHFERLVNARKHLPAVIEDLQALAGEDIDQARLYQLLGDALMQEGQLDEALDMYRQARRALVGR